MIQIPAQEICESVDRVIVAGWTGRNAKAIDAHIEELALLGVDPPSRTPLFYHVDSRSVCNSDQISVLGEKTSGEVEPVVFFDGTQLYLGVGSDHTDRDLEVTSVAHSKAVCPKPMSETFWLLDSVIERIDQLELRSWITNPSDGDQMLYQTGSLVQIKPLLELLQIADTENAINPKKPFLMFCGTIPVQNELVFARHFHFGIFDDVANQSIEHSYTITPLEIVK